MKAKTLITVSLLLALRGGARSFVRENDHRSSADSSFYFEIGAGAGFRGPHFFYDAHAYVEDERFVFGLRAGNTFRSDGGAIYYNAYDVYDSWFRYSELSFTGGYRIWKKNHLNAVAYTGPAFQLKKYREWPSKGSGMAPFAWYMLMPVAGKDRSDFGLTLGLDLRAPDKYSRHQFNFLVFGSFFQGMNFLGATIELSFGKLN